MKIKIEDIKFERVKGSVLKAKGVSKESDIQIKDIKAKNIDKDAFVIEGDKNDEPKRNIMKYFVWPLIVGIILLFFKELFF